MTESEATKKMCPIDKRLCLGSMCMGWRWFNTWDKTGYCGIGGQQWQQQTGGKSDGASEE